MDLRSAALAGFRWMTAVRLVAEVVAIGSTIALARLIEPAEYGHAVIALAFAVVTTSLFQDGLVAPLVRLEVLTDRHVRAAVGVAVGLGAVMAVGLAFVLPAVFVGIFGDRTVGLVALLWPIPLFEGLGIAPRAMLQRRLDFRALGLVEVTGALAGTGTAIALAASGSGARAIVIAALVTAGAQCLLLLATARPPRPAWPGAEVKELLGFGAPAAFAAALFQVGKNIDYVLVGARLGTRDTALYWRSYTLAYDYQLKVSGIMFRLAFPLYSRAESLDRLLRLRTRIVRAHATALFPALVALIAVAPTLVPFLYGQPWRDAVVPTQLLAIGGLTAVITTGAGPLMLATGHPRVLLTWNLGNVLVLGAVVFALARLGLTTVAIGVMAYSIVSFLALQLMLERLVGLPWRSLVGDVGPAAVSGAAMLAVSLALAAALRRAGAPALLELITVGAVGAVVYLTALRLAFKATWADMALLASSLIHREAPAA
jgi:O-antigen/teichoic acid export membrane protein